MAKNLLDQISQLHKKDWFDLLGLIDLSIIHLLSMTTEIKIANLSCSSISLLGCGTFNHVYRLVFSDNSEIAASLSSQHEELFDPKDKQSEVHTMKFVRQSGLYPDILVPEVYAWDVTYHNPAGAPYVLMSVGHGETLDCLRDDVDNSDSDRDSGSVRGLDALPHAQQLSIVKSLANFKAALSRPVPFDEMGSIVSDPESDAGSTSSYSVGPLVTLANHWPRQRRGPFKSEKELWRSRLEGQILHAMANWCSFETDELSTSISEPHCTPHTFAELFQLLSALIGRFEVPHAYSRLVLHHPDLALRNVLFDKESLLSGYPRITGVVDWGGMQVLPLMLTASYPDDLMSSSDHPLTHPGRPEKEDLHTLPSDWISTGDPAQLPNESAHETDGEPFDHAHAPITIRRLYLRSHFSVCYAEQLDPLHGDTTASSTLTRAKLFANATYYAKFHEVMCAGWISWVTHADWIRETYWSLRDLEVAKQFEEKGKVTEEGEGEELPIIGPDICKPSMKVKPLVVLDLSVFEGEKSPCPEESEARPSFSCKEHEPSIQFSEVIENLKV